MEYKFHTAPMGQFNMHQRGENLFFGAVGVEILFFWILLFPPCQLFLPSFQVFPLG
jgi:hypothetical protein